MHNVYNLHLHDTEKISNAMELLIFVLESGKASPWIMIGTARDHMSSTPPTSSRWTTSRAICSLRGSASGTCRYQLLKRACASPNVDPSPPRSRWANVARWSCQR